MQMLHHELWAGRRVGLIRRPAQVIFNNETCLEKLRPSAFRNQSSGWKTNRTVWKSSSSWPLTQPIGPDGAGSLAAIWFINQNRRQFETRGGQLVLLEGQEVFKGDDGGLIKGQSTKQTSCYTLSDGRTEGNSHKLLLTIVRTRFNIKVMNVSTNISADVNIILKFSLIGAFTLKGCLKSTLC